MVMLDRIFMTASWEDHFPMVSAHSITRIGSDHSPILVETGNIRGVRSKIFRFETTWIKQEGFQEWVLSKWPDKQNYRSIDHWKRISTSLRRSLKGWNGNWGSVMKKRKQDLMLLIGSLDHKADSIGLDDAE